jgi:hypothetical protein
LDVEDSQAAPLFQNERQRRVTILRHEYFMSTDLQDVGEQAHLGGIISDEYSDAHVSSEPVPERGAAEIVSSSRIALLVESAYEVRAVAGSGRPLVAVWPADNGQEHHPASSGFSSIWRTPYPDLLAAAGNRPDPRLLVLAPTFSTT